MERSEGKGGGWGGLRSVGVDGESCWLDVGVEVEEKSVFGGGWI